MTESVPSVPAPPAAFLPAAWYWLKRTPLVVMVVYCVISLVLEENYPFTHYPMYSNPSAERSYYLVSDGDGKPLPVAELTGITCPKIGKMFRTKASEVAAEMKVSKSSLGPEQLQAIGSEIFTQLRHYAKDMHTALPPKLQLSRVDISYDNGRVIETPQLLAKE